MTSNTIADIHAGRFPIAVLNGKTADASAGDFYVFPRPFAHPG
jgi:hypothetical protein